MKKHLLLIIFSLFFSCFVFSEEMLQEVTVSPGDTMWSIANKYLKDPKLWSELVKYNNLGNTDPTVALPGSKIKVPITLIKEEYQNARLVKFIPDVNFKRKGEVDWHEVTLDMTLRYEDSLRTMKGGQAQVRFPSKELVQINENSYVVLKPEKILQEIQLIRGDIRASRAKVIMKQGTVVKPQGGKSDFQAKIREDDTEVVFVYKGKVDVTAQGKTVTVPEGFGTQVPKAAPPMKPMPLSTFNDFDPAELTTNAPTHPNIEKTNDVMKFNPPTINPKPAEKNSGRSKSMVSENMLVSYKLQLATDEKFTQIILEKTESMGTPFDLKKQSVPDGNYFMRVAFIDALGTMGTYSIPNTVTKDSAPPSIENLQPSEGQKFHGEEAYCDVIGDVKGAAMVSVNDEVLFISPTGRFDKFINLKEGENIIKVLARDVHGNETVINRKVTYSSK